MQWRGRIEVDHARAHPPQQIKPDEAAGDVAHRDPGQRLLYEQNAYARWSCTARVTAPRDGVCAGSCVKVAGRDRRGGRSVYSTGVPPVSAEVQLKKPERRKRGYGRDARHVRNRCLRRSKIAQPLLIEGLKRLEYRGYDSAGIAVIDDQGRAAHPPRRRADQRAGRIAIDDKAASRRAHRHGPHPLGDARRAHRSQRPPAHRRHRPHRPGPQRHHRKLRRPEEVPHREGAHLHQPDRHRSAGDADRRSVRRVQSEESPARRRVAASARGAGGAARGRRDLRHRRGLQGRAGHAGRRPQGQPADHRRGRGRVHRRLRCQRRSSSTPRR